MAEKTPEIRHIATKTVVDGKELVSCEENEHPDPKIGYEFVCTDDKGIKSYANWPRDAISRTWNRKNISRISAWPTGIDKRIPEKPLPLKKGTVIMQKNENDDLILKFDNGRSLIVDRKNLWTDTPPEGAYKIKPDPDSDREVIMTPTGEIWAPRESRELSYAETLVLAERLQEQDKNKREKIGPLSSVDNNLEKLQQRIAKIM